MLVGGLGGKLAGLECDGFQLQLEFGLWGGGGFHVFDLVFGHIAIVFCFFDPAELPGD